MSISGAFFFFLLPRAGVVRVFKFSSARVRLSLLPRDGVLLSFRCYAARVRLSLLPRDGVLLSFRCYAARVRFSLLPRDRVVLLFSYCAARVRLFSPTPCHSERSRGISWKRCLVTALHNNIDLLSPRGGESVEREE